MPVVITSGVRREEPPLTEAAEKGGITSVSTLDVSIQLQILNLPVELNRELQTAASSESGPWSDRPTRSKFQVDLPIKCSYFVLRSSDVSLEDNTKISVKMSR